MFRVSRGSARTILLALAAFAMVAPAIAQESDIAPHPKEPCGLEVSPPASVTFRGAHSRGYEVSEPASHKEQVLVRVTHRGAPCSYVLSAASRSDPGQPRLGGADGLNYDLTDGASGASVLSQDSEGDLSQRVQGSFGEGAGEDMHALYLTVPANQTVPAGSYSDLVGLKLFAEADTGALGLVTQRDLLIAVDVPPIVRASIGLSASQSVHTTDVNLGVLHPGLRRDLAFSVECNVLVNIRFKSTNDGALRSAASGAEIPYRLSMGGREYDLDGSDSYTALLPGARTYNVQLEVGDFPAYMPAGDYTDQLVITIKSL